MVLERSASQQNDNSSHILGNFGTFGATDGTNRTYIHVTRIKVFCRFRTTSSTTNFFVAVEGTSCSKKSITE